MLHDLGLLATLGARGDGVRFDANLDPHHHYVCVRCGMVRDFTSPSLARLRLPEALGRLGSVDGAHVEVRGQCARCLARRPARRQRTPNLTRSRTS
jgi:Fur family peroxide stress response transcriptional regulator